MTELKDVLFYVTNACNMKCRHCHANSGQPLDNELNLDEIKTLFKDLYDMGIVELELTGGEPFVRPDFIRILDMANTMDFSIKLLTNGTLLDPQKVQILSDMSIRFVQIPIEGIKSSHELLRGIGTFEPAIKAVTMLKDAGLNVQVRMTATKKSISDVKVLAESLVAMDVDSFLVTEFIPIGRGLGLTELLLNNNEKQQLHNTLTSIRKNYGDKLLIRGDAYGYMDGMDDIAKFGTSRRSILCGALRGDWCIIMSNGVVTTCDLIQFYTGNIRLQKMSEIWNSSPIIKAFNNFESDKLKGACGKCNYKVICGGCRALAFFFYGDFYDEDPMCLKAEKKLAI